MSNVPAKCLEKLLKEHPFYGVEEVEHYVSKIYGTQKFLFSLHDNPIMANISFNRQLIFLNSCKLMFSMI